ncbi:MAG TPA: hypothetical protein VFV70_05235, partial [Hyphomonadaceae bacterium]|nr:hypothetical protein [Hyphomonadaceae bacterium]
NAIMGAAVGSAKDTLGRAGFVHARNIGVNGRQYDLWWSGRRCVGFTSYNGRVTDVRNFQDEECGYYGGGNGPGGGPGRGPGGGGWGGGSITRDLEGLRVDRAKDMLRDRGFRHERNIREDGKQYDLWSNNRTCVGFASYRGTVSDARSFRDSECYGGNNGQGWGGGRFDPRRLEGVSVDAAKSVLRQEGYGYARAIRVNGKQYDLWASDERRRGCVGFTSYNGRVTAARSFDERDCY